MNCALDNDGSDRSNALWNVDLSDAMDALAEDCMNRARSILQAYRRNRVRHDEVEDALQAALERRELQRRFSVDLDLDSRSGNDNSQPRTSSHTDDIAFVNLPEVLDLSDELKRRHADWAPKTGEPVAVYFSTQYPSWPGKLEVVTHANQDMHGADVRLLNVQLFGHIAQSTHTIRSHIVPLRWLDSTLFEGSASSRESYDEAIRSCRDRPKPKCTASKAGPSHQEPRPSWLLKQALQEERPDMDRMEWQENEKIAAALLRSLAPGSRSSAAGTSELHLQQGPASSADTREPEAGQTHSRGQIKRARRKFQEVLDDPVLKPLLQSSDTTAIQAALALPRRQTPQVTVSALPDVDDDVTRFASIVNSQPLPVDFVSALGLDQEIVPPTRDGSDEMDTDDWHVVSRKRQRRPEQSHQHERRRSKQAIRIELEDIKEENAY